MPVGKQNDEKLPRVGRVPMEHLWNLDYVLANMATARAMITTDTFNWYRKWTNILSSVCREAEMRQQESKFNMVVNWPH